MVGNHRQATAAERFRLSIAAVHIDSLPAQQQLELFLFLPDRYEDDQPHASLALMILTAPPERNAKAVDGNRRLFDVPIRCLSARNVRQEAILLLWVVACAECVTFATAVKAIVR
jgi:hypothetical protein